MEMVSVKAISGYVHTVQALGADPVSIMRSVHIAPEVLLDPDYQDVIAFDKVLALFNLTEEVTGCHHFGAQMGFNQSLASLGDIGQLAKLSSDVETALQAVFSYLHLYWQNTATLHMETFGRTCYLQFSVNSRGEVRHFVEASLVAIFRLLKLLTGSTFKLEQAVFSHYLSGDGHFYSKLFKAPVKFSQEKNLLVFSSHYLKMPISTSDQELNTLVQRYLENLDSLYPNDVVGKVKELIKRALPLSNCTADATANMLSMHRRTMHRLLRGHGTSFTELLVEHRRSHAEYLLKQTDLPLTQIANSLGYADLSAFSHAFKNWHGLSPAAYRKLPVSAVSREETDYGDERARSR